MRSMAFAVVAASLLAGCAQQPSGQERLDAMYVTAVQEQAAADSDPATSAVRKKELALNVRKLAVARAIATECRYEAVAAVQPPTTFHGYGIGNALGGAIADGIETAVERKQLFDQCLIAKANAAVEADPELAK